MRYLLGVDFGGSSSKATLLNEDGDVVATSIKEYPTFYPNNGWAEQNPDNSYDAFVYNVRSIIQNQHINPEDIEAISLDGATHTSILLDERDRLVRPAIYWTDRRSVKQSEILTSQYSDLLLKLSLNTPSPLWTLPQLMWVREQEPANFNRIHKILFMKDYVRYRLTGDFVTDSIEAMGSMLLDAQNNRWSGELCSIAGISESALPEIVAPTEIISPLCEEAIAATGLSSHTKIIAGATDTSMEIYAAGAIHKGQATIKLATAGRICIITDTFIVHPQLFNYRHVIPGFWYPGTATKSCAASYRWFRDVLSKEEINRSKAINGDPYILMDDEAEVVQAGSDNLYFHPYLQGEISPYLDNDLKASFTGISSFHTKGHFNRAVMEGVAYSLRDSLELMINLGLDISSAAIIGGGAKSNLWRQIVADILNLPLTKHMVVDSSLGSAMLAGVAVGVFENFEDSVNKSVRKECEILPNSENRHVYDNGFQIYKQIHDALEPIYKTIGKNPN